MFCGHLSLVLFVLILYKVTVDISFRRVETSFFWIEKTFGGSRADFCIKSQFSIADIGITSGSHSLFFILIILPERARPGLLTAPKLFLMALFAVVWPCHVAPWSTPATHSIGFLCRIRNGGTRLFSGIFQSQ